MTSEEAKTLLLLHSFAYPDLDHPKMASGFLGSLRPFRGLRLENFHEVMEALRVLAPGIQTGTTVDKEVMRALWSICYTASLWGLPPDGMLWRNDLITEEEQAQLATWVDTIAYAVSILLEGCAIEEAFSGYQGRAAADNQSCASPSGGHHG